MKARTCHSLAGMRRYIQMSREQVFIFVEGRDLDPDVYSRICGPICRAQGVPYEFILADRICNGGGGKNILIRMFDHLTQMNAVVDVSGSSPKAVMFYLDKDVDDIFHCQRISHHVVYTRHYNIENHLFSEGELLSSAATAGSIDADWIRGRVSPPHDWRERVARRWRTWIALCLVARKLRSPHPVSYSMRQAPSNPPAESVIDPDRLAAITNEMHARSGLSVHKFEKVSAAAHRLTHRLLDRSQHDLIFNGKWYTTALVRELEAAAAGRVYNRNGAEDRLIGSLISSVDFDGAWVEHFRQPLQTVLRILKNKAD